MTELCLAASRFSIERVLPKMDVSLVLTHRCNLACGYCFAGEQYRNEVDDSTLRRAVDLLFADDAPVVQLSFFGGEPFLAFDAMKRAVELAEREAERLGRDLLLQCTTNGTLLREEQIAFIVRHRMHVTVSIDGVAAAHDLNRPRRNGTSSFDQVRTGLRRLVKAGVEPDAMMVISPATAALAYQSTSFLWGMGAKSVRANMVLGTRWTEPQRDQLREDLLAISSELVARRLRGEPVSFEPFEKHMQGRRRRARKTSGRSQIVVSTSGNLYPCAPMVGGDRDDGPEAGVRIGHLDQGLGQAAAQAKKEGTRCNSGGPCECAAYLETGDRHAPGPNGLWYAGVCAQMGAAAGAALARATPKAPSRQRRSLLGIAATVAGAAALPALFFATSWGREAPRPVGQIAAPGPQPVVEPCEGPELETPGDIAEPVPVDDPPVVTPGGIRAPVEPPQVEVDGDLGVDVEMEPAPAPPEVFVRGKIAAP